MGIFIYRDLLYCNSMLTGVDVLLSPPPHSAVVYIDSRTPMVLLVR